MTPAEGSIVAERFRIDRPLGKGGMGEVWLAHDLRLDTACAIKFLRAGSQETPQMRARFEREAKSAAQLRSPNVVEILDHGDHDGVAYIAMELLEGEDLANRLRRVGRLSPAATSQIVAQIARALTKAHAAGLVHRDLKPANIFLVPDEAREIVKVLDFGVVKTLASGAPLSVRAGASPNEPVSATQTGSLMGTPHYMSPEQATANREIDTRSDLWSLAIVAFQCMTGRLPFEADDFADLVMKILLDPIPRPSSMADDLPPEIDAWFAQAAARDPAMRYQTARELADALRGAIGSDAARPLVPSMPPAASPAPLTVRTVTSVESRAHLTAQPTRRPRARVAALVVAGAVLCSGAIVAASWISKASTPKRAVPSQSGAASQRPSGSPLTGPATADDCSVTQQCPDVLHRVCAYPDDNGQSKCVPSPVGARVTVKYEGMAAVVGIARKGEARLNPKEHSASISVNLGRDGHDGTTEVSLSIANDLEEGFRPADWDGRLETRGSIGEARRLGSARYAGEYRCINGGVNITSLDYRYGGHIAATLQCDIEGGTDKTPIKGSLTMEFFAQFPTEAPR